MIKAILFMSFLANKMLTETYTAQLSFKITLNT